MSATEAQRTAEDLLLYLIEKPNENEKSIKKLIEAGANVNTQDNLGKTPIMLAIENKPEGFQSLIEILCKANANINIADKRGKTAAQLVLRDSNGINDYISNLFLKIIHRDCMNKSQSTARKLFELGCPLWQAVLLKNADIIEHMILYGSPINHHEKPFTPLTKAVELMNLEVVKVLIKYGADVDLCDNFGCLPISHYGCYIKGSVQCPEIIRLLLDKTVLLRNHLRENIFQLRRAFECGNVEVVKMLLEYHEDILNMKDQQLQTPLHYISYNCHSDIIHILRGKAIDVNVRDAEGRTPLFMATLNTYGNVNTFKFLLKKGVDVNARSTSRYLKAPVFSLCNNLQIKKKKYFKIIQMFLRYGLDVQFLRSKQTTIFDIILRNGSFYMAKPFLAQLAMLDEEKKPIVQCIRNRINSHKTFKKYFESCKVDLTKMKNYFINDTLTLYTFLVSKMNDKQILKSFRFNPNALSKFEKLKDNFHPNNRYYAMVEERISSIVTNLKLLYKGALVVCKLLKLRNNPHHIAVTEIIDYLSDEDLRSLTKVKV